MDKTERKLRIVEVMFTIVGIIYAINSSQINKITLAFIGSFFVSGFILYLYVDDPKNKRLVKVLSLVVSASFIFLLFRFYFKAADVSIDDTLLLWTFVAGTLIVYIQDFWKNRHKKK